MRKENFRKTEDFHLGLYPEVIMSRGLTLLFANGLNQSY